MGLFQRYIGIDYSGARTAECSLKGLRIYHATPTTSPAEIPPPPGKQRYWTRRGIADWLTLQLREGPPALVGIDHGFSFPLQYFDTHGLPYDWECFLEDFQRHWPTDAPHTYVDFILDGMLGHASRRMGHPRWRRLTEVRCRAKSVFHFNVQGSVAKSTHCGLPWLYRLRCELRERLHFWPFDGWTPAAGRSVLVEAYPALWNRSLPPEDRDPHQHDAYTLAHWMRTQDAAGSLSGYFHPELTATEQSQARIEGWIFGLPGRDPG